MRQLANQETSEQTADKIDTKPETELLGAQDVELLQVENLELREKAAKLEELLGDSSKTAQYWAEQHRELERLLEEKSDVIRELHEKMQELLARPVPAGPDTDQVIALNDELEQARRQLQEDEEALMKQMRAMEIQMSRERAELARQRTELQRLHNELRHELELAARESELRERLQPFQRRHQEMLHRKGVEPTRQAAPAEPPPAPAKAKTPRQESGMLRRLFRRGDA